MTNIARANVAWTNVYQTIVLDCPVLMGNSLQKRFYDKRSVSGCGTLSWVSQTHAERIQWLPWPKLAIEARLASWG